MSIFHPCRFYDHPPSLLPCPTFLCAIILIHLSTLGSVRNVKLTTGRPRDAFFLAWINFSHTYRCHYPDFVSAVVCGQLFPYGIDGTKVRGTIRSESHHDLDELGCETLARIAK